MPGRPCHGGGPTAKQLPRLENPYEFSQDKDEDKVLVFVNCNEDDGESSVIIWFDRIGPHLFARRIDLAG